MKLRIGTRDGDLARWQTRWVAARLVEAHPGLDVEEVVLGSNDEQRPDELLEAGAWPTSGSVAALEEALVKGEVDLAVHSYEDLPTTSAPALVVAAVPVRAAREDRIVCKDAAILARVQAALEGVDDGPPLRIAATSARREAQFAHWLGAVAAPTRGDVSTHVAQLTEEGIDAVAVAGAALDRLGLAPEHVLELPLEDFPTAPAQGALAVQVRRGTPAEELVRAIDDELVRRAVDAERAFLAATGDGSYPALGVMAELDGSLVRLHAQLFADGEGVDPFDESALGTDPVLLGQALAKRALEELAERS